MARIFISYKRVDKDKVFKIKDQIESALGEKCWIDLDGIESDAQFINVIIKAIRDCEVLLFMYSKTHTQISDFEKDWTVRELNFAAKKEKRIVFVNIDGSPLSDEFEFMYGTKQQVDATSNDAMNKLCTDLLIWMNITSLSPNTSELAVSSLPSTKVKTEALAIKVGNGDFRMITERANMHHKVFISYSRRDKKTADFLCNILKENGIEYWIDKEDIYSSSNYKELIVDAIDISKAVIFISSANSNSSINVIREIGYAVIKNKPILPLMLDNAPYAKSIRLDISDIDQIDFKNPIASSKKLIASLMYVLNK